MITFISIQDGKPKFLPIYARFYHLLGVIDAHRVVYKYKSQFLTISDFAKYFWYIRMNMTKNSLKVEFSIISKFPQNSFGLL